MFSILSSLFLKSQPPNYPKDAASCHPNRVLPFHRLSLIHDVLYHLNGFLPRSDISQQPSFIFLSNPPPAYVSYVLGADWRSQIMIPPNDQSNTKANGCSRVNGYSYIPRPNDGANEAEHCLRMKRCGATLGSFPPKDEMKCEKTQIFGWPSKGGVWVYRIPEILRRDHHRYDDENWLQAEISWMEESESEREKMDILEHKVRRCL